MAIDPKEFFETPSSGIRHKAISGGMMTVSSQWIKFSLTFVSGIILARLLTPEDYGLVGMVIAVTGFISLFKDLGLSHAIVQKDSITHQQVTLLFWVNIGLSLLFAGLTASLSSLIVNFYDKPQLAAITNMLAVGFILGGISVQHMALLKRRMMFGHIAAIEIASTSSGIALAIFLALRGAGYWALVGMLLCYQFVTTIGSWTVCSWRPGLPSRNSGSRGMLVFGGNLTGFNVVNYFARNLDNLLIGRVWGETQLGLYSKAYSLLLQPLQQIKEPVSNVAIPTLSRLQNNPEKYRHYHIQAQKLISYICMPIIAVLGVLSNELVLVLFGEAWAGVGPIFGILAAASFVQTIISTVGWTYISLGRTGIMLKWGALFSAAIVLSFFIGLPWGAKGVALSYTICTYLLFYPQLWAAYHKTPVTIGSVLQGISKPVFTGILTGLTVFAIKFFFLQNYRPFEVLLIGTMTGIGSWGFLFLLWSGFRGDIYGFVGLISSLKASSSSEVAVES